MKKNQIELIKKEIETILNFYNYELLENNYTLLNKDIFNLDIKKKQANEKHKKNVGLIKNKYSELFAALKSTEYQTESENFKNIMQSLNYKLNVIYKTKEAYNKILKTVLNEILFKILQLYFKEVKTSRDHNDFLKIFSYDVEQQKHPFKIKLMRDSYNNFELYSNLYNKEIESYYYIKYWIDINNNIIFDDESKKQEVLNYNFIDFESLKNEKNIFNLSKIKKDIEKILKTFESEKIKVNNAINKSKNIINEKNIYNIRLNLLED